MNILHSHFQLFHFVKWYINLAYFLADDTSNHQFLILLSLMVGRRAECQCLLLNQNKIWGGNVYEEELTVVPITALECHNPTSYKTELNEKQN